MTGTDRLARIVSASARHPRVVLAAVLLVAAAGESARRSLGSDVIPDLSDPQIALVAEWPEHPADEVAARLTEPLTAALAGIAGAMAIRGSSMAGMAYVDVVFASSSALPEGRLAIAARVEALRPRLPPLARVRLGPEASSTGWVLEYALVAPEVREAMHDDAYAGTSLVTLRRLQDERLGPAIAAVPGVAEVAALGGEVPELLVELKPDELRASGVALLELAAAVRAALAARTPIEALPAFPLEGGKGKGKGHPATSIGDVARVREARAMANGAADLDGKLPVVGGIVIARRDADVMALIAQAKQVIERERKRLPAGVELVVVYDRSELVGRVHASLLRALTEEIAVVVAVVLSFLLHARSALVPLVTLPLVVLLTFLAMWLLGVPATVMSLGGVAIALGMAVDADVVALEACHRRLELRVGDEGLPGHARRAAILAAAGAFTPAILTTLLIAALTLAPALAFTGETGRLLRPLVLTKALVIGAAALVAVTVAPALRDTLLRGRVVPELGNPLTRGLVSLYRPVVFFALRRPLLTVLTAGLAVASCLPLLGRLRSEFLPRIDEGDLLFMPTTSADVAPELAAGQMVRQDRALRGRAEVASVFGKIGRAETATDPAPFAMVETTVRLHPREAWPKQHRERWYSGWAPAPLARVLRLLWPDEAAATPAALVEALDRAARLPGWTPAWTAPARGRMDMMSTGLRTPVGVRVTARDPARLDALGAAVRAALLRFPGTKNAVYESLGGQTYPRFFPDAAALALHRVDERAVRDTAELLFTAGELGVVESEGQAVRVRLADLGRRPPQELVREVTVRAAAGGDGGGQAVPLALLGRAGFVTGPTMIRAERQELATYVQVDLVDGVDLQGYVEGARRAVASAVPAGGLALEAGERIDWIGQYELLTAGQRRLALVAPLVLLSMLGLLFLQFRSWTEALIVLAAVPFALVGSVWALFLLDYPLSAPVWIGLLSVLGLAMQTGVVMVVYIDEAFYRRLRGTGIVSLEDIVAAHAEGTVRRLRPKIMTVATMAAGLMPLLWSDGAGAAIMKRIAAPLLGGLASSAFLTLEVIPVLYTIWRHRQLRRALRTGVPLERIVGPAPSWGRS